MKSKVILYSLLAILALFLGRGIYYVVRTTTYKPQNGDIIFHVSESSQSAAIKLGTLSRYSHCGIIVIENGKIYVVEAEGGVEKTPIKTWIRRGKMCHHYRIMRLKDQQPLSISYKLGGKYEQHIR